MNLRTTARATPCVAFLLGAIFLAACVGPTQQYRLVDLGALVCGGSPPTDPSCVVGQINDWCEVAGSDRTLAGQQNAHVWRPAPAGSPTKLTLGPPAFELDWRHFVLFWDTPQPPMWKPISGAASSGHYAYDINNFGYVAGRGDGPRRAPIIWATRSGTSPTGLVRRPSLYLTWPSDPVTIDSAMAAIKDADRLSGMPRDAARAAALTALSNAPRADLY